MKSLYAASLTFAVLAVVLVVTGAFAGGGAQEALLGAATGFLVASAVMMAVRDSMRRRWR